MTFEIGWVFAEVQILEKVRLLQNEIYHRLRLCRVPNSKKWKWLYLLNYEEYCDEILHTHWNWQAVANEIVKWHLDKAEVQILKEKKSETGPIFWTFWYIVIKFCIPITSDMI